jgi:hypothetical protein
MPLDMMKAMQLGVAFEKKQVMHGVTRLALMDFETLMEE